ncbi:unnamed protein product, partial [Meganyctiphanes norvegica]
RMKCSSLELVCIVLSVSVMAVLSCLSSSSAQNRLQPQVAVHELDQSRDSNRIQDASYYHTNNKDNNVQRTDENNDYPNDIGNDHSKKWTTHKTCTVSVATKVEQHSGHCVKLGETGVMGCKTPSNLLVPYHQECY